MTREEQAERTARNILELVEARRQLAAVRAYLAGLEELENPWTATPAVHVIDRLRDALAPRPAPTTPGDPA